MTPEEIRARIDELEAKEQRCLDGIKQLHDKVTSANRRMTDAEDERLEALNTGFTRAETEKRALERLLNGAEKVAAGDTRHGEPGAFTRTTSTGRTSGTSPEIAAGLRAVESAPGASHEQREAATVLVEQDKTGTAARWAAAVGTDHYLRAFAKLVRDPQRGHIEWTGDEQRAFADVQMVSRAMSLTDAAGGHMVPLTLDPAIMLTGDGSADPVRRLARVVSTATDQWQGVTSAGVTTRWAAEASEANDDAPTLASAPIPVHKADSFVPYSIEVGGDAVDLVDELRRIMMDAKAQHEAAAFITGSGSGQPTGLITALDGTTSEIAPATAETFASADVYSLLQELPPRFRDNASWLAELSTINELDQAETTNGARLFPGLADSPPSLLRRRIYEASEMDGVSGIDAGATADNFVLLVGDLRAGYVVVDRIGTTVELVPHLFGATNQRPTGERGLYMYWRVGADVVVDNALRVLSIPTAA